MNSIRSGLRGLPALLAITATGCSTTNLQSVLASAGSPPVTGRTVHATGPVETYSRIARGALGCWFRSDGNFKKAYMFHADVEADSKPAEITIHERDPNAPSPRSLRALKITISPSDQGSQVVVENLRFPASVGREMMQEIARWADDQPSCISPGGPSLVIASPAATASPAAPAPVQPISPVPAKAARKP
jgi:hypothetical protein